MARQIVATTMAEPPRTAIENYYDERVEGKLRDFIDCNPRIEAAMETLAEWAPADPRRVLEIGCGIGATAWRMARAWPNAEVVGVDLSPLSIGVAKTCFRRSNLSYRAGLLADTAVDGKFDLIVLMDVYEHIALAERAALHAAIKSLLSDQSRVVMTVPTPHTQESGRIHNPSIMQPIDEDIGLDEIVAFARATDTEVAFYRLAGIWRYADYAHAVFGRFNHLGDVAVREYRPAGVARLKQNVKRLIGRERPKGGRNYLGHDVYVTPAKRNRRFDVPARERKRRAAAWTRPS